MVFTDDTANSKKRFSQRVSRSQAAKIVPKTQKCKVWRRHFSCWQRMYISFTPHGVIVLWLAVGTVTSVSCSGSCQRWRPIQQKFPPLWTGLTHRDGRRSTEVSDVREGQPPYFAYTAAHWATNACRKIMGRWNSYTLSSCGGKHVLLVVCIILKCMTCGRSG